MCRQLLRSAAVSRAAPATQVPTVLGAGSVPGTATTQAAEVLHIRGTRADGSVYRSDFSAVVTTSGQIRSQNAVYWFSTFAS